MAGASGMTAAHRWRLLFVAGGGVAGLFAAYFFFLRADARPSGPETVALGVGNRTFTVEIARTPEEHRRGLSQREHLDPDGGMLFVYPEEQMQRFWMKDTLIPLSLAYLASDGTIREIYDLVPQHTEGVPSEQPAQYVLELNRGAFREAGARRGDRVRFPEGWRYDGGK